MFLKQSPAEPVPLVEFVSGSGFDLLKNECKPGFP